MNKVISNGASPHCWSPYSDKTNPSKMAVH